MTEIQAVHQNWMSWRPINVTFYFCASFAPQFSRDPEIFWLEAEILTEPEPWHGSKTRLHGLNFNLWHIEWLWMTTPTHHLHMCRHTKGIDKEKTEMSDFGVLNRSVSSVAFYAFFNTLKVKHEFSCFTFNQLMSNNVNVQLEAYLEKTTSYIIHNKHITEIVAGSLLFLYSDTLSAPSVMMEEAQLASWWALVFCNMAALLMVLITNQIIGSSCCLATESTNINFCVDSPKVSIKKTFD